MNRKTLVSPRHPYTSTTNSLYGFNFASVVTRCSGSLIARAISRSRHFAVNMAIVQQPKVEARLHMLLWHLADRWGTVTRDGVFLPVRLTQTVLAALVAAQRPTVSSALATLERDHRVTRTNRGWLLHGAPPGELQLAPETHTRPPQNS